NLQRPQRYEDWTSGDASPKWLDVSDASGAHFARKIRDTELLELVETRIVTGRPATAGAQRPGGDPPLRSQPLSDRLNSPHGNDTSSAKLKLGQAASLDYP